MGGVPHPCRAGPSTAPRRGRGGLLCPVALQGGLPRQRRAQRRGARGDDPPGVYVNTCERACWVDWMLGNGGRALSCMCLYFLSTCVRVCWVLRPGRAGRHVVSRMCLYISLSLASSPRDSDVVQ